ncbi:MAG: outer membrane protein assembly factor BamD [Deltaproteobacteria bacterium]|nr:outer membrane protein assembly factor BamD [Deltaproteobacteria bacterium]
MKGSSLAVALCAALLCACAEKEKIDITAPVKGEAGTNAEKGYKRGIQEMKDANYIEATRYLEWVRNNFPYSQYASLSELALADMAFDRDDYATAAGSYSDFVKGHPSHPKADYAAYRVGLSWFNERPGEWFFLPPGYEKDQTPVRQALDTLQKFTLQFPKSEMLEQAQQLMDQCRQRLAAHERYVAEFYRKREVWKAAAGRYLVLADQFGDLDQGKVRDEGLWGASEAFAKLDAPEDEAQVLTRFVEGTTDSKRKGEAQERLKLLASRPKKVEKAEAPADAKPADTKPVEPKADVKSEKPADEKPAAPAEQPK